MAEAKSLCNLVDVFVVALEQWRAENHVFVVEMFILKMVTVVKRSNRCKPTAGMKKHARRR
jgi:hypothetical protein